jgi:hypothetical protein
LATITEFRYVERDDMKVGLQCLELKASIYFNVKKIGGKVK